MEGIINVAGTMPRIGTTTVALQLIQFLKRMGYDAAYVERNSQDYLWGVQSMYADVTTDKASGRVTCEGTDMYPEGAFRQLTAGGAGYDYLICDFGNIQAGSFDMSVFTRCTAMIIVGGIKANEIFQTESALKMPELEKAIYVFNFIRDGDEKDILEMMEEKASMTAFAPWMPDPIEAEGETADECFMAVMNNVVELTGG